MEEFDCVLTLQSVSPQPLSYDNTFNLGDFYVSVLNFRHTLFMIDYFAIWGILVIMTADNLKKKFFFFNITVKRFRVQKQSSHQKIN